MYVEIENLQFPSTQPPLPDEFHIESIDNFSNEDIKSSVFKTFVDGSDRSFEDLTSSQQKAAFNHWFNRDRPFHRSAILVMKDDEVVGFYTSSFIIKTRNTGIAAAIFPEAKIIICG